MKKTHILVIFVFCFNFMLLMYGIFSGNIKKNIKRVDDNKKIYRKVTNLIRNFGLEYEVLTGRDGGLFVFSVYLDNEFFINNNFPEEYALKKISTNEYFLCIEGKAIEIYKRETFRFAYYGSSEGCVESNIEKEKAE